ncbi:MAG: PfkB family carbohydrate kinase [Candidatus Magasanikbacteria bacterium]
MKADLAGSSIAVVGDVILDSFLDVSGPTRVSAEDDHAMCHTIERETLVPGGAGCAARCASSLGDNVQLFSVTGNDGRAVKLTASLEACGIDAHLVADASRPTSTKRRIVLSQTGAQLMVLELQSRNPISKLVEIALLEKFKATNAPVVLLSDYARGLCTPSLVSSISQHCLVHEKKLIVDGRERPLDWYTRNIPNLYLITPNKREAGVMVGRTLNNQQDIELAAEELSLRLGCNVLITLSEDGAFLRMWQGGTTRYSAFNKKPISVSGAGDTLVATTALAVASGISLDDACLLGQIAASISVSKPGSDVATGPEFREAVEMFQK